MRWTTYTHRTKTASDHHGSLPPIDSNALDRPEAAGDDADHPAEGVAGHQREAGGELDHTEHDHHPPERVEAR